MPTKALDPDPEFTFDAIPSEKDGETGRRLAAPVRTRTSTITLIAVLAVVVGVVALYSYWPPGVTVPQPAVTIPPAPPPELTEPAIRHPVENIPGFAEADAGRMQFVLPPLDDGDAFAKDAIETILNGDAFVRLLATHGLIRRIVATVDNLPRKNIAVQVLPIKPVPGVLATTDAARGPSIAIDNADRYAAYVEAADAIDTGRLVGFYIRLYPLFQQAYAELGYPDRYFNDRLISVIDHLLAAPEPQPPVYVFQPRVMFEFTDPELEALSAGQKILVRTGIGNELRLKAKLRKIRRALTAGVGNR